MITPDDLKFLAQSIAQMSDQHAQAYEHVNRAFMSDQTGTKQIPPQKEEVRKTVESTMRSIRAAQDFGQKLPSL